MKKMLAVRKNEMKSIFSAMTFLVIVLIILSRCTEILRDKTGDSHILHNTKLEQEYEWDVIIAGPSRARSSIYPMQLWNEYGFTSFNNAQSGEAVPVSYWTCKSIIRRCHPKVLVLDTALIWLDDNYYRSSFTHSSLDPLPLRDRVSAILNVVSDEEKLEFLFPITIYHDRISELTANDFKEKVSIKKGATLSFVEMAEDMVGVDVEGEPPQEVLRPSDVSIEYLDKIVELCNETDTELLLVALPGFLSDDINILENTHDMSKLKSLMYANWMVEYAAEKEIDALNFYPLVDELGIDWVNHFYNSSHLNYWGGVVVTDYMGQYLKEHYDLPDRRQDPGYEQWNDDYEKYEKMVESSILTNHDDV